MTNLPHLIERCESGGGSVPRKAGELADWSDLLFGEDWKASQADMLAEALNGSLDAVVSLIEQKLPGARWLAVGYAGARPDEGCVALSDRDGRFDAEVSSPARALLAAFLNAYANKEGTDLAPKASP